MFGGFHEHIEASLQQLILICVLTVNRIFPPSDDDVTAVNPAAVRLWLLLLDSLFTVSEPDEIKMAVSTSTHCSGKQNLALVAGGRSCGVEVPPLTHQSSCKQG